MKFRQAAACGGIASLLVLTGLTGCSAEHLSSTIHNQSANMRLASAADTADPSEAALSSQHLSPLSPLTQAEARFGANVGLTPEAIAERFQGIGASYKVGQAFVAEDAEFVRLYATVNASAFRSQQASATSRASRNFNKVKTAGGMTGRIQGNLNTNGSGPITHRYSVGVKMTSSSKVSKTKIRAEIRSYGVVGSSGIGLTYSATPTVETTAHTYNFNRSGTYTSVAVYDTIIAYADFHGKSGSFNVQS